MKTRIFLFLALTVAFMVSCVSGAGIVGNVNEIPPHSMDATPFEGTWYGKANNMPYELEFKGNAFVSKAFGSASNNSNQTSDLWGKGLFTYTDNTIVYYTLNSYNPQGLYSRWTRPQEGMQAGKTSKVTANYSLADDTLIIDKAQYSRRDYNIRMPDDLVFFHNQNNYTVNHLDNVKNGEVFTIEAIDDKALQKFSFPMLGSGYWSIEQREPGSHGITFRQKLKKAESGYYKTNEISGSFHKDFTPGVYRFFLFTNEFNEYSMPDYLPKIPDRTARIVIGRTSLDVGVEVFYDYVDIPLR